MSNGKLLITARAFRKSEGPHKELLRAAGYALVESTNEQPLVGDELAQWLGDVDGAILGLDAVTEAALAAARRLRVISRFGVGVDAVDVPAATRHGVVVTITPGANSVAVAELALALLLALARSIPYHDRVAKAGQMEPRAGHGTRGRHPGPRRAGPHRARGSPARGGLGHARAGLRSRCCLPAGFVGLPVHAVRPGRAAGDQRCRQPAPAADPGDAQPDRRSGAGPHEAHRLPDQHGARRPGGRRCPVSQR